MNEQKLTCRAKCKSKSTFLKEILTWRRFWIQFVPTWRPRGLRRPPYQWAEEDPTWPHCYNDYPQNWPYCIFEVEDCGIHCCKNQHQSQFQCFQSIFRVSQKMLLSDFVVITASAAWLLCFLWSVLHFYRIYSYNLEAPNAQKKSKPWILMTSNTGLINVSHNIWELF